MNTKIEYLYRNKMNCKILNTCVLPGLITNDQIRRIIATLRDGKMFIPRLVRFAGSKSLKIWSILTAISLSWMKMALSVISAGYAEYVGRPACKSV